MSHNGRSIRRLWIWTCVSRRKLKFELKNRTILFCQRTTVGRTHCEMAANASVLEMKDKRFDSRGTIPQKVWPLISIKGDDSCVDDGLSRWGWTGTNLVVTPVITTEAETGKVLGSRWAVRGPVASYTMKATSLWTESKKNVTIQLGKKYSTFIYIHGCAI